MLRQVHVYHVVLAKIALAAVLVVGIVAIAWVIAGFWQAWHLVSQSRAAPRWIADELRQIAGSSKPIVDVRSAKFVGAVESEGRLLSAYVATGKTTEGTDFVVGFVLRVANDQVVGVN